MLLGCPRRLLPLNARQWPRIHVKQTRQASERRPCCAVSGTVVWTHSWWSGRVEGCSQTRCAESSPLAWRPKAHASGGHAQRRLDLLAPFAARTLGLLHRARRCEYCTEPATAHLLSCPSILCAAGYREPSGARSPAQWPPCSAPSLSTRRRHQRILSTRLNEPP